MAKKLSKSAGWLLTGATLTALLATPLAGSAADLSGSSFSVRAQNSQQTTVTAVKPGFKKSAAPTTPAPTPTPEPTPTAPAATVVYQSNFSLVGSKPAEWQMQKDAAWQQTTVIGGTNGGPNYIGQNAFPYNTELRFKLVKALEAGSYTVKFKYLLDSRVGSASAPPYWYLTVNGVTTKISVPYNSGAWRSVTFEGITVPSGGASEVLFTTGKATAGNFNLYDIADVVISKNL